MLQPWQAELSGTWCGLEAPAGPSGWRGLCSEALLRLRSVTRAVLCQLPVGRGRHGHRHSQEGSRRDISPQQGATSRVNSPGRPESQIMLGKSQVMGCLGLEGPKPLNPIPWHPGSASSPVLAHESARGARDGAGPRRGGEPSSSPQRSRFQEGWRGCTSSWAREEGRAGAGSARPCRGAHGARGPWALPAGLVLLPVPSAPPPSPFPLSLPSLAPVVIFRRQRPTPHSFHAEPEVTLGALFGDPFGFCSSFLATGIPKSWVLPSTQADPKNHSRTCHKTPEPVSGS